MSLTAADVAEIMRLLEQSAFDELILETDGLKLCLKRNTAGASVAREEPLPAPPESASFAERTASAPSAGRPASAPVRQTAQTEPAPADPGLHPVTSPLLGTFYRAPKPGAPPFVEVGSVVDEDTVVAIIEVMKLMNTVRAGVRGTVTEILVGDGMLVEYEQPLVHVRKSG